MTFACRGKLPVERLDVCCLLFDFPIEIMRPCRSRRQFGGLHSQLAGQTVPFGIETMGPCCSVLELTLQLADEASRRVQLHVEPLRPLRFFGRFLLKFYNAGLGTLDFAVQIHCPPGSIMENRFLRIISIL
jgi:hypothetical protein